VTCHGAMLQLYMLSHRSERTRQPDAIVLDQETLLTVLTRSVWFRAKVTVL
jgi:hypothetical protein